MNQKSAKLMREEEECKFHQKALERSKHNLGINYCRCGQQLVSDEEIERRASIMAGWLKLPRWANEYIQKHPENKRAEVRDWYNNENTTNAQRGRFIKVIAAATGNKTEQQTQPQQLTAKMPELPKMQQPGIDYKKGWGKFLQWLSNRPEEQKQSDGQSSHAQ